MKHSHTASSGSVQFDSAVLQSIRCHARSSMDAEICGVLLGDHADGCTLVNAAIAGEKSTQGAAHVTFTQDTWEHIYKIKDRDFPEKKIVGWYHSHPGFGVFLSEQDTFIHENFFSAPYQVAWVFDPHSDEEGCFGWFEGKLRRTPRFEVVTEVHQAVPQLAPALIPEAESTPTPVEFAPVWQRYWRSLSVRLKCVVFFAMIAALLVLLTFQVQILRNRFHLPNVSPRELIESICRKVRPRLNAPHEELPSVQDIDTVATNQANVNVPDRSGHHPEANGRDPIEGMTPSVGNEARDIDTHSEVSDSPMLDEDEAADAEQEENDHGT